MAKINNQATTQTITMCVRPASSSSSNDSAVDVDDDISSDNHAESSPPVLTDFSNLVGALHNAVDAIRKQNGLPPLVSDAARRHGPNRYDLCPHCGGKPTAVVCPGCGRSVVAGGEARWSGWLPW